jgi:hypothetical protein
VERRAESIDLKAYHGLFLHDKGGECPPFFLALDRAPGRGVAGC